MSLVLVASVPGLPRRQPRRVEQLPCPTCGAELQAVGELDGADVGRCVSCGGWWIDASDPDIRARRTLAAWRPYDEPEPAPVAMNGPDGHDQRVFQLRLLAGGHIG